MAVALLPDALWDLVEPFLPIPPRRPKGGRPRASDRACLTGIVFVLRSGIPWQMLPQELGCGSTIRGGLWTRHIVPLLTMRRTEHGSGLGRWRWVVERAFAWLNQFRRLRVRYDKRADAPMSKQRSESTPMMSFRLSNGRQRSQWSGFGPKSELGLGEIGADFQ